MRYIIIGAGAVGGTIGGRLAQAGHEVALVARGAHGAALREHGLRLLTPDESLTLRLPVLAGPEEYRPTAEDVLVLAVKTQDTVAALDAWAPVAGDLPLLCAQNGVANERLALRRFRRVYGVCVWLPSLFLEPGVVVAPCAPLTGMLHVGPFPGTTGPADLDGVDDTARRIAADLESARFLAPARADVMRWKYAKLLMNLGNAVEAVAGPLGSDPALGQLVKRAAAEGVAALTAAGIAFADQEEQLALRGDRMDIQPVPGAPESRGSSWQSLRRGTGSIEADYLNGEIVLLGRLHGVPTPVNEALVAIANTFAREGREPGSLPAAELAALV
ncbi:ketopantoate reductase family protein [Streptomyces mayteni]